MAAPVLQIKRGLSTNVGLASFKAGEPGFTSDKYDFYIGLDGTAANQKFFGSARYWTRENGSTAALLKLVDAGGTNSTNIQSPNSLAGSVTYVLPSAQGAVSSVLTNDGSGNLTWASGSSNATFTGITTFSDTTDSTTSTNGAVQIRGGLGVAKSVNIGGNLNVTGIGTITTLNSTTGYITTGIVTTLSGTTATYTTGNLTTGNLTTGYITTGIVTTLSGTNINYTGVGTITTLNSTTGYITTGIVTTLSGTTATYTTGNLTTGYINTGIVTTLSGTTSTYTTGNITTGYINTGIVTTLSGTTATYTNGNFTNGYITTGIVTTLSGTYLNYSGISTFSNTTDSTTSTNGALIVSGGLGVAKSVNIGGNLSVTGVSTFTGALTVNGATTFNSTLTGTISTATRATTVDTTATSTNASYYPTFVASSSSATGATVRVDADITYNPSTNTLTVPTINTSSIKASDGTNAITVSNTTGAVGFANSVTVNGDFYVIGATTQVETAQLKVQDSLIDLGLTQSGGVLVPPGSNLGLDLGLLLNWYGASAKKAAVYWKNSTSRITLASDVTEASGVLTAATYADVEIGSLWMNDTAGQNAVASYLSANSLYSGSAAGRYLQNITVDAGTF